jgi:hypothetical protein
VYIAVQTLIYKPAVDNIVSLMNDYKNPHNHHQVNKLMEMLNVDNLRDYIADLMNGINDKDVDHVLMKIHNEI